LIEAIDIRRSFAVGARTLDVLRGVSLAIAEGESTAITGMSGAGKSTLLYILGGLDRPTSGQVRYRGRDLYAAGDRERSAIRAQKIGFVFQAYHLLPELTVLENVLLPGLSQPGAFLQGGKLRARAEELLARVGLAERAAHRPNELSGGEQQRVALARALMNGPELLLADEPTGNLDSKTGEDVLGYLFDLAAERRLTLVIVTHNEAVAARCRRHVVLRDGLPVG
jgi:predicted ABC-type transport system involved in lysophospholipase L1 biosynthesis ATPase subunit